MNTSTESLSPALTTTPERFREGKVPALARAISVVENERTGFQEFLHRIMSSGPSAARVGFTGPPGAGKSSLVAAAATAFRAADEHVGIVADQDPPLPLLHTVEDHRGSLLGRHRGCDAERLSQLLECEPNVVGRRARLDQHRATRRQFVKVAINQNAASATVDVEHLGHVGVRVGAGHLAGPVASG